MGDNTTPMQMLSQAILDGFKMLEDDGQSTEIMDRMTAREFFEFMASGGKVMPKGTNHDRAV